jgi:signal transduction histidine kinase
LYLSREFVVRHQGAIWVESQEGRGSTFYVALPVAGPSGLPGEDAR